MNSPIISLKLIKMERLPIIVAIRFNPKMMLLLVTPPPTTPSLAHAPPVNVNVNEVLF